MADLTTSAASCCWSLLCSRYDVPQELKIGNAKRIRTQCREERDVLARNVS